jgi:hypothetical protein
VSIAIGTKIREFLVMEVFRGCGLGLKRSGLGRCLRLKFESGGRVGRTLVRDTFLDGIVMP